jgi:hypothetical protein
LADLGNIKSYKTLKNSIIFEVKSLHNSGFLGLRESILGIKYKFIATVISSKAQLLKIHINHLKKLFDDALCGKMEIDKELEQIEINDDFLV